MGASQGASIIMSVPCCHKDLHRQFAQSAGSGSSGSSGNGSSGFALPGLSEAADAAALGVGGEECDWDEVGTGVEEGQQLNSSGGGAVELRALLSPLLRHGLLRQRWLDLMTDALRAQLLRSAGYR